MEFVFIIIGFVLLIKASDFFVDASINIAKIFKVSEVIIGATIVSIGTTLPETMVSAASAFKGHGDISYGNALGSIICNTALIAATALIFTPGVIKRKSLKIPVIFFFSSFAVYSIFAYGFNYFSRVAGIVLVSIFIIYVFCIIKDSKKSRQSGDDDVAHIVRDDDVSSTNEYSVVKSIIILAISAAVIAFASNLLVDNGTIIARKFGVPESVIGFTLIAFGTSLPEFSTAITSIVKGHHSLSIGNIIGANFFNVVLVTGLAAIVGPFTIPMGRTINGINSSLVVDIPLAFTVMIILCLPTLIREKTCRWQGILLYLIYAAFLFYQFYNIK